ncbi:branched-chain amino acid ABC transporter permease [Dictyobacter formicarum]|uniref:Branched-chain amino acid ABC transporter permease n=1 Tax=Dictyobacter formicarum TaxID=2778368 RepID=A0ABQ3VS56_9CHLR|nr:branched-chain amino acid ABC transporter permease [Dictyobacter formicarum]GHO88418.1 branched-chain amino acid ABC transporter permease [Dictyobacter formicarum]
MIAFLQVVIAGLVTGSLYGLLTLGIVLIYRTTGVLNFAYGAISALCACFMYILLTGPRLNFWLALCITLLFAPLLGIVLERGFARPVLHAPVFTKAIATLALALVLETITQAIWPQLAEVQHFSTPFEGHAIHLGGLYISAIDLVILVVTTTLMLALNLFLMHTRLGIAMRAMADSIPATRLMGASVGRIFMLIWALSAFLAAVCGILLAGQSNLINVQFMDPILLPAFIGAVLGGLDSLPGSLIGGILVGLVSNLLAYFLAGHTLGSLDISNPAIRDTLIFVGFVIVLLIRPQGLRGRALLRRV